MREALSVPLTAFRLARSWWWEQRVQFYYNFAVPSSRQHRSHGFDNRGIVLPADSDGGPCVLPRLDLAEAGMRKYSWEWNTRMASAALYYHLATARAEFYTSADRENLLANKDVVEVGLS